MSDSWRAWDDDEDDLAAALLSLDDADEDAPEGRERAKDDDEDLLGGWVD